MLPHFSKIEKESLSIECWQVVGLLVRVMTFSRFLVWVLVQQTYPPRQRQFTPHGRSSSQSADLPSSVTFWGVQGHHVLSGKMGGAGFSVGARLRWSGFSPRPLSSPRLIFDCLVLCDVCGKERCLRVYKQKLPDKQQG